MSAVPKPVLTKPVLTKPAVPKSVFPKQNKELIIYASELAGFLGMHKFQSQAKVWNSIWDRVEQGEHKTRALSRVKDDVIICHSTQEYLDELCKQSKLQKMDMKKICQEISLCDSALDLEKKNSEIEKQIVASKKTHPEIYRELRGILNQETSGIYGNRKEQKSIQKHEETHYVKINSKNDKFYSLPLFAVNQMHWGIGGRIDGKIGETVVEVKNRKYKLFEKIPLYELIQIECYMRLLGSNKTKLIQHLWRKNGEVDEDVQILVKNDSLWKEILEKLKKTSILFTKFLADANIQTLFLQCTSDEQRQKVLETFVS